VNYVLLASATSVAILVLIILGIICAFLFILGRR
jgi:hypothetical protein